MHQKSCNEDEPGLFVNQRANHLSPNSIAVLSNTTIAAESVYNIDFINKKSLIPISGILNFIFTIRQAKPLNQQRF